MDLPSKRRAQTAGAIRIIGAAVVLGAAIAWTRQLPGTPWIPPIGENPSTTAADFRRLSISSEINRSQGNSPGGRA
ncbi:hypothetical protein [Streptosporangium subroseum]|uniref:hypothetical protein n=1 Tax=Streptosporangium subroseum TaxID=106412 RepID=UPI00308A06B0|nr:hypothetical protein OHB15_06055 [Streptosporangium subroseum]